MSKIPFSKDELTYTEVLPGPLKLPVLNTPITPRENFYRMVKREDPLWIPTMMTDELQFNPSITPDNIARAFVCEAEPWTGEKGGKDMFGTEWVYVPIAGGSMEKTGRPLMEDANDWKDFVHFPDLDSWDWEGYAEKNKGYTDTDRLVVTTIFSGFFERLISFMDFEGAAMALIDEDQQDAVKELFTELAKLYNNLIDHYRKYFHVDMVFLHDDWGAQKAPFFSQAVCEEMIVPYMKMVVDHCHEVGMLFELHSCGKNDRMVPCIIKTGADIWGGQPIVDKKAVIHEYGENLMFGVHNPNGMIPGVKEATPVDDLHGYIKEFLATYAGEMPKKPFYYMNFGSSVEEYMYFYEESRKLLCGE